MPVPIGAHRMELGGPSTRTARPPPRVVDPGRGLIRSSGVRIDGRHRCASSRSSGRRSTTSTRLAGVARLDRATMISTPEPPGPGPGSGPGGGRTIRRCRRFWTRQLVETLGRQQEGDGVMVRQPESRPPARHREWGAHRRPATSRCSARRRRWRRSLRRRTTTSSATGTDRRVGRAPSAPGALHAPFPSTRPPGRSSARLERSNPWDGLPDNSVTTGTSSMLSVPRNGPTARAPPTTRPSVPVISQNIEHGPRSRSSRSTMWPAPKPR